MLSTLTSKAQITLPKDVRQMLQLEPGDKVAFVPQANPGLWDAIPLGLCECGGSGCSGVG